MTTNTLEKALGAYDIKGPTSDTTTRLNFATYGTSMKATALSNEV